MRGHPDVREFWTPVGGRPAGHDVELLAGPYVIPGRAACRVPLAGLGTARLELDPPVGTTARRWELDGVDLHRVPRRAHLRVPGSARHDVPASRQLGLMPDAGSQCRTRPSDGLGQCRRVSPTCGFRSHVATSTAGFDLVRRCRFVRPQRLLGCGSRREAWRGSRRRGWRRCSGSARGLARSRCCFCRWRVA